MRVENNVYTFMKYNYIIAGGPGYYSVAYDEVKRLPNVRYFVNYISGLPTRWLRLLARVTFNIKYGRYLRWILKPIVYPAIFKTNFPVDNECVYLFFESQYAVINTDYLEYIKKNNPQCKLVLFMQDVVASLPYYDIADYKKRFDLVLSYDKQDCERYGLVYHPTPYSHYENSKLIKKDSCDVFFCGTAKNRYETIMMVYRICKEAGLKVLFYINGVEEHLQEKNDDIVYNTPITYLENLSHIASAKCIIEVMQKKADGFTPRLWEAIFFDKHLITNNGSIKNTHYYDSKYIHEISNDLHPEEWIDNPVSFDQKVKESKSPVKLLKFIEDHLC